MFFLDIHGGGRLQDVVQQDKMRRVEEPCAPVVGGAVQLIGDFVRHQPEKMDIL